MQSLREIMSKKRAVGGIKEASEWARNWLIENGYIYNPTYGWEIPENLERFGLNPNMNGVPVEECDETNSKEVKYAKKDAYGAKTGEYGIKYEKVVTGRKVLKPTQNWIDYINWKKNRAKAWYAHQNIPMPEEF